MRRVTNCVMALWLLSGIAQAAEHAGWESLFDGASLEGWTQVNGQATYEVIDGAIVGTTRADGLRARFELIVTGGGGDIVTEEIFGACEMQLEFRLTPGANSGIKYFVDDYGGGQQLGLEYQLLDDDRHPDAKQGRDGNRTLASLYDIQPRATLMTNVGIAPKTGEWQHARIVARADGTTEHWLNGVMVLSFTRGSEDFRRRVAASKFNELDRFGERNRGRILLQDHGDEVRFRSAKIRTL